MMQGIKMKSYLLMFVALLGIVSCTSVSENNRNALTNFSQSPGSLAGSSQGMTLGVGDEIVITVWRHNELQRRAKVDLDGNINLPLAGEVHVADMTVKELRDSLQESYARYLVDPQIDINVETLTSKNYIVLGEVNNPGNFQLNSDIDLLSAIAGAGGTTNDANDDVLLFRRSKGVVQVLVARANLNELNEKNFAEASVKIANRDIIYVPTSTIANIEGFMQRINNIIAPLLQVQRGVILWPDFIDVLSDRDTDGNTLIVP